MSSNLAVLTHSHKIIASKKRARREQVKEVLFNEDARRDYLTGFHKRKVEKKENAKKKAIEREKQERLEARREKRKMLAEQAVSNAREVEKAYGAVVDSEDEDFSAFSGSKGKQRDLEMEDEYSDEEQHATVTVVEHFDPQALLHGPSTLSKPNDEDEDAEKPSVPSEPKKISSRGNLSSVSSPDIRKNQAKVVKKAKDIKYQTKAARQADKKKQQRRKVEKAERAGGKSSRKHTKRRGKR